ncbi:MobA/MobL family protein [Bradyrhizobium sp. SYSU BS000235]|uniref:MobA/MobL family protein n=1 Tax=Bradyrhizobium sp. SYSU BS000235 TaxID=3411332 RepID=UPI003C74A67D
MDHGFSRLEHSSFGKSDQRYQPGMLAKHAVYISRLSASDRCIAINFSTNTHKFRREVAEYEESVTRKNARLADKIVINLDNRMDAEAMDDALRAFAITLTKGAARIRIDVHLNDPNNPHAHVLFIDKSVYDGSRVQRLSDSPRDRAKAGLEPNGTQWLRDTWEKECNSVLDAHGYDFRLDMRSRLDRGLDKAKEHVEWRASQSPEETIEAVEETATVAQERFVSTLEEQYLAKLSAYEQAHLEDAAIEREFYETTAQRVEDALEYHAEYQRLKAIQANIAHYKAVAETARADAGQLRKHATAVQLEAIEAEKSVYYASEAFDQHKTSSGRLKGFELSLFGYEIMKSPARHRALGAQQQLAARQYDYEVKLKDYRDAEDRHTIRENEAREAEIKHEFNAREVLTYIEQTYGKDKTLHDAEYLHVRSVSKALEGVDPQEVFAEYEIGAITREQAVEALALLGATYLIDRVEERHRVELEQWETMEPQIGL